MAVVGALAIAAFVQVGYWRDGENLYGHALRVTSDNWLASNNLGMFWLSRDDPGRALPSFQEAARIRPNYEQAYFNQGVALMRLSRYAEAVGAYRQDLQLEPSNTDGWVNLGLTLLDLRRVPEALKAYETAVSQRPDDPLALAGAAFTRAQVGDSVAALEYLNRLQRVDPSRASALARELGFAR